MTMTSPDVTQSVPNMEGVRQNVQKEVQVDLSPEALREQMRKEIRAEVRQELADEQAAKAPVELRVRTDKHPEAQAFNQMSNGRVKDEVKVTKESGVTLLIRSF